MDRLVSTALDSSIAIGPGTARLQQSARSAAMCSSLAMILSDGVRTSTMRILAEFGVTSLSICSSISRAGGPARHRISSGGSSRHRQHRPIRRDRPIRQDRRTRRDHRPIHRDRRTRRHHRPIHRRPLRHQLQPRRRIGVTDNNHQVNRAYEVKLPAASEAPPRRGRFLRPALCFPPLNR
jgi:hypothetical protein